MVSNESRLIDVVCRSVAGQAPVAVCGELAANEQAVALLVGLGVRELNVAPLAISTIKQAVRLLGEIEGASVTTTSRFTSFAATVMCALALVGGSSTIGDIRVGREELSSYPYKAVQLPM